MLMHFLRGRNVGCTQDDPTVLMDKYLPSAKLTYANIANCKISLFIGKSSINDPFSIAILVYWRVGKLCFLMVSERASRQVTYLGWA